MASVLRGPAGIARTAELPAVAPAGPTLVWRAPDAAGARQYAADSRFTGGSRALMRTGDDAGEASANTAPASDAPSGAAVPAASSAQNAGAAAPAPLPDIDYLAEQVSRVLARQLELERERRGLRWS